VKPNHFWIIERKDWRANKGWMPFTIGGKTRAEGCKELNKWKKIRNTEQYRLRKYIAPQDVYCPKCGVLCAEDEEAI
jgi:hypothetical protein